jgi:hypothetical protein
MRNATLILATVAAFAFTAPAFAGSSAAVSPTGPQLSNKVTSLEVSSQQTKKKKKKSTTTRSSWGG